MKYKKEFESIHNKYSELKEQHDELVKESRALVNFILRIQKKCTNADLWLMASIDPYRPLETDIQQGPMITKLFEMTHELKRKI